MEWNEALREFGPIVAAVAWVLLSLAGRLRRRSGQRTVGRRVKTIAVIALLALLAILAYELSQGLGGEEARIARLAALALASLAALLVLRAGLRGRRRPVQGEIVFGADHRPRDLTAPGKPLEPK